MLVAPRGCTTENIDTTTVDLLVALPEEVENTGLSPIILWKVCINNLTAVTFRAK